MTSYWPTIGQLHVYWPAIRYFVGIFVDHWSFVLYDVIFIIAIIQSFGIKAYSIVICMNEDRNNLITIQMTNDRQIYRRNNEWQASIHFLTNVRPV